MATASGLALWESMIASCHQPIQVADGPSRSKNSTSTAPTNQFSHFLENFSFHQIKDWSHLIGVTADQLTYKLSLTQDTYTLVLAAEVISVPLSPTKSIPEKSVLNILGWAVAQSCREQQTELLGLPVFTEYCRAFRHNPKTSLLEAPSSCRDRSMRASSSSGCLKSTTYSHRL